MTLLTPFPNCRGEIFHTGEVAVCQVSSVDGSASGKIEVTVLAYCPRVDVTNPIKRERYQGAAYQIDMTSEHKVWLFGHAVDKPLFCPPNFLWKRPDWRPSDHERVVNVLSEDTPYDKVKWRDGPFVPKTVKDKTEAWLKDPTKWFLK